MNLSISSKQELDCKVLLLTRFVCLVHSKPNVETRKFAAEKWFMSQLNEETGEQISNHLPRRQGAWGIYGIRKQGSLRRGEHGESGERGLEIGKR